MTRAAVRTRVTSFAPQFLVDDLERSIDAVVFAIARGAGRNTLADFWLGTFDK